MAFLALVELLMFLFGSFVLVTQILVPLFKGTRFFPAFRGKVIRTMDELYDTLSETDRLQMERALAEAKKFFEEEKAKLQESQNVPSTGESTNDNSK